MLGALAITGYGLGSGKSEVALRLSALLGLLGPGYGPRADVVTGASFGLINGLAFENFSYLVTTGRMNGISIGLVNVADSLNGVQIGLLNYAGNNPPLLRLLPGLSIHIDR